MPKLYTVKALSELFDKSQETIYSWIQDGIFPHAFKIKDGWYVPVADIKKIMQSEKRVSNTQKNQENVYPKPTRKNFVNRW